jgi:hypothetical protein
MISKFTLMRIRNFLVSNFFVNINTIIINNKYIHIDNYFLLFFILKLIPFYFYKSISKNYDINFIYSYDNIFNITNIKKNYILPIIINYTFINDTKIFNFNQIKFYNSNIPFNYIIDKYNLHDFNQIKINYLYENKSINKILYINEYKDKKIYDLFY